MLVVLVRAAARTLWPSSLSRSGARESARDLGRDLEPALEAALDVALLLGRRLMVPNWSW